MPPSGRPKPAPTAPKKPDTDGDGLSDEEERRLGTNPRLKDTDFEADVETAPLDAAAAGDMSFEYES